MEQAPVRNHVSSFVRGIHVSTRWPQKCVATDGPPLNPHNLYIVLIAPQLGHPVFPSWSGLLTPHLLRTQTALEKAFYLKTPMSRDLLTSVFGSGPIREEEEEEEEEEAAESYGL